MKSFNNFINGKEVPARDGRTTPVIDPVTGEQYATAALSGPNDVDDAMKAAAKAGKTDVTFDGSLYNIKYQEERLGAMTDAVERYAKSIGKKTIGDLNDQELETILDKVAAIKDPALLRQSRERVAVDRQLHKASERHEAVWQRGQAVARKVQVSQADELREAVWHRGDAVACGWVSHRRHGRV